MSPFFSPWTGKLPFKVIEFRAFVQEYGLEEVVERELSTAHFENEKKMEKKWKAPGAGRTSSQARGTQSRSGSSPVHLITSPADLQVHYYTQVENRPSEMNIFASGTGYSHRITMGSQGPPPPAVKGLYSIISRGGINAVKQKVIRENYILKLTRAAELEECGGFGEDWYDSDCYD